MRTLTIVLLLAACKYQTGSTGTPIEEPDAGHTHDGPCHNGLDGSRDPAPDAGSYYPDAYIGADGGSYGGSDAGSHGGSDAGSYLPDAADWHFDAL